MESLALETGEHVLTGSSIEVSPEPQRCDTCKKDHAGVRVSPEPCTTSVYLLTSIE